MSQPKSSSRWGSFLQQAVAGVESRLDTILAEDDGSGVSNPKPATSHSQTGSSGSNPSNQELAPKKDSNQDSAPKKNERLQERLAKAVVTRNAQSRSPTPAGRPRRSTEQPDTASNQGLSGVLDVLDSGDSHNTSKDQLPDEGSQMGAPVATPAFSPPRITTDDIRKTSGETIPSHTSDVDSAGSRIPAEDHHSTEETDIRHAQEALEALEDQRQQKNHDFLERIDSLQAKLQFLTQEAIENAKDRAQQAVNGSANEKLATKDEKIALLIQEGQKLSQNELRQSTAIKKFRTRIAEEEKKSRLTIKNAEKSEAAMQALHQDMKGLTTSFNEERVKAKALEEELLRVKNELASKTVLALGLEKQLSEVRANLLSSTKAKFVEEIDAKKPSDAGLEEALSNERLEKKLLEDRYKIQLQDLESELTHERERFKAMHVDLLNEVKTLEGRLESYRTRAEEVSSTSSGDTHAKLYRQIETLQSQYTVASENWRGIESSLLTRISALEKDRDELQRKEGELRRKTREAVSKSRRLEDELEQSKDHCNTKQEAWEKEELLTRDLRGALEKAQLDAKALMGELQALRAQPVTAHLEAGKLDPTSSDISAGLSPIIPSSSSNGRTAERPQPEKASQQGRRQPASSPLERPSSRKASGLFIQNVLPPIRHDSFASLPHGSSKGSIQSPSQAQSVQGDQQDDYFDGIATPATPDKMMNDMFSASTAAAGPSVQLVERMSAAVRRLESEKVASKEDMGRLVLQRDEAREQIIGLMNEAEAKREADARVSSLEKEVKALNSRYQTTLEMLGEKSERVEELQADIADMKQIYKDVLEKTIR